MFTKSTTFKKSLGLEPLRRKLRQTNTTLWEQYSRTWLSFHAWMLLSLIWLREASILSFAATSLWVLWLSMEFTLSKTKTSSLNLKRSKSRILWTQNTTMELQWKLWLLVLPSPLVMTSLTYQNLMQIQALPTIVFVQATKTRSNFPSRKSPGRLELFAMTQKCSIKT